MFRILLRLSCVVLCGADALDSFLDLLATSFPGKMNRASFRSLVAELRQDPGMNDETRYFNDIYTCSIVYCTVR